MDNYRLEGTLMSLKDVGVTMDGRAILKGVNATVENIVRDSCQQGQVVGLLGPSGAGKTTLLNAISGARPQDSGEILIHRPGAPQGADHQLSLVPACLGQVGVVTQDSMVLAPMTALQNLVYAGVKGAGLTKAEATDKATDFMNRFGLYGQRDQWPYGQLSGGQRQRLAILQQLMAGHLHVLMDEPFTGLDPVVAENFIGLIREVTSVNELLTIIVVTHDIGKAISIADHLWLMGRDRDEKGVAIEGARILEIYDLINMGLAWQPNIRELPEFQQLYNVIMKRFREIS